MSSFWIAYLFFAGAVSVLHLYPAIRWDMKKKKETAGLCLFLFLVGPLLWPLVVLDIRDVIMPSKLPKFRINRAKQGGIKLGEIEKYANVTDEELAS